MSRPPRLIIALILSAAPVCCGPSIRQTTRSDNAFIRCFDLDNDRSARVTDKQRCWSEWLEHYVYNQYDDKIGYAQKRLRELNGPEAATDRR